MQRRKKYNNCEICGRDISQLRRGTRTCSPEHSLELIQKYHQVYYQKNHLKYADKLREWRTNNPEKWREQRQRSYERKKQVYADIKKRQAPTGNEGRFSA